MTDDDLEQLLRRTYREVAARTGETVSATRPATPAPEAGGPSRWQPVLAAAAVITLVVAGLVVLAGRGGEAPATMGTPRHIVPGWTPRADPDDVDALFALTEIESTTDVDRLVWSAEAGSVTLGYDRLASALPAGDPTTVRRAAAVATDRYIAWFGPAGGVATVSIDGDVDRGVLDEMVDGLLYVDDTTWATLTSTGGFVGGERPAIQTWPIDEAFEILLEGDLHEGMWLSDDTSGWSTNLGRCARSINWELSDIVDEPERSTSRTAYTLAAPGAPSEVNASVEGEPDRIVAMTSLEPVLDISVGVVVYDDRAPNEPLPACDAADR